MEEDNQKLRKEPPLINEYRTNTKRLWQVKEKSNYEEYQF